MQPATTTRSDRLLFAAVEACFLAYALLFIYRTSFVVAGRRYFSLFDDAMVSMRYARNVAQGYGLVWNHGGPRIEGYTNPLWVVYMALVHRLGVPVSKVSLVIQLTGAALLAWNLAYVRRIALTVASGSRAVALGAVLLTAAYLPIDNWSLQGMEVGPLVLLTSASIWLAFQCMDSGAAPLRLYLLLATGTLVRPDMVVLYLALLVFLVAFDAHQRRRHLIWGLALLAAVIVGQTVLRMWYFGGLLPNTYYLKMAGVPLLLRVTRGLYVLLAFVLQTNVLFFWLAFAMAAGRDRRVWLLLWVLLAQMIYSVYVGGDAWEYWGGANRYICIAMPGFFVVLSLGLHTIVSALVNGVQTSWSLPSSLVRRWSFALVVVCTIVAVNCIHGPSALAEALLIHPPLHTGRGDENDQDVELALGLQQVTTADATIALTRAGTIPYFADRAGVDLLGKTDAHVANLPARMSAGRRRFIEFRPGHVKFDYAYSIGALQPDVIVNLWTHAEEARPLLRDQYQGILVAGRCVYARRASTRIVWNRAILDDCDDQPSHSSVTMTGR